MNNSLANAVSKFCGKPNEDPKFFIKNLADIANLENWPEEKKTLMLRLSCSEKALEYIASDPIASNEIDFGKLSNLIIKRFTKEESFSDIQDQFSAITQKPKQSVVELSREIIKAAHKLVKNEEQNPHVDALRASLQHTKFMEALRPDIRVEVRKFGPISFDAAVKKAKDVEKALEVNNVTVNAVSTAPSYDIKLLLQQQLEQNKEILELKQSLQALQSKNKVSCHICSKPHRTTDCWHFPSPSSSTSNFTPQPQNNRPNFQRGRALFRRSSRSFHPYGGRSSFRRGGRRNLNE